MQSNKKCLFCPVAGFDQILESRVLPSRLVAIYNSQVNAVVQMGLGQELSPEKEQQLFMFSFHSYFFIVD